MNFTEFSLHEKLQQGIAGAGYVECTPVQEQVLKNSLEGRDLYVQSQTGTGKTAAYLVSIIQQMLSRQDVAGKKALVMVPTRELAVQVQEEAEKLCSATELVCSSFYGGVGYDKQVAALKKGVDIMIGTPGRVIDLHEGGQMDLSSVAFLCIDEADRMFDMGFYPDLRTLIKVLPAAEKRQTMLFSATLNSYVKNLAWEYTRNPAEITIAADNITVDEIDQELLHVSSESKMKLLTGIISSEKPESLIIFCNTKRTCEVVAKRLKINGIQADYIIGDLPQKARLRIMDDFKAGKIKCLVATDVAARGIDVNDLAMVINYDLPNEAENYVHRIGRTARAGKSGKAYTFCSEQDVYSLPPIERYIEKQIPARVAEESMLGEDKSEGMYIRTENYHEDYNDKSEFGRRRQAEYERSGRGRRGRHAEGSGRARGERGKGRYSKGNKEASREYKRDRRVFNAEEEAMLATMSMDERMKLYKEKFASTSKTAAASTKQDGGKQAAGKQAGAKGKKASGKGKKSYKDSSRKQYSAKNEYSGKNRPQGKPSSAKEASGKKRGIFGRIKSLFSKK
ncbi:MAG: DEAD/DEAH box helicase [Treponema sp.]|jgi:ATP-dependent RNA helicase RhlB|nr:DEAD/DEAH box helicase [Treponema sp.]MBQ1795844.1 DEAD/DEAH box helicase [Treponema sp.]MBQ2354690.1 DEAD/DEAH box helicase [Treponema sp.]MBQ2464977.1 DEAD/DEAH box helicase [Treponema sp.]MBQ2548763.1 DEAD/DEAH box helicase [Treponema sp.]